MNEPILTTHYELRIDTAEVKLQFYAYAQEHPYYCKTLEEAKEMRDTIINMLKTNADTRSLAYKLFRDNDVRIVSINKSIFKIQCIRSEVIE